MAARPLAVLLLPEALERFALREQAADLLRAPGVVAAEPGRTPYARYAGAAPRVAARMAAGQARRMVKRLPGRPVVVVIFDPLQWPLANAIGARVREAEVWYGHGHAGAPDAAPPLRALYEQAVAGAAHVFATDAGEGAAGNAALRERLRRRGVEA